MNPLERVVEQAAREVVPGPRAKARLAALAKSLLARTELAASKFPQTRGVMVGGSYAKGTWLPGHVDLDLFVKFDPSTPEHEFERVGLEIGAAATRGHPAGKKYAQHPYTEATIDGIRANVVPCYGVNQGEWKSAADRSPFHVALVESLPEEKKTHIRLLKKFMGAVGVYGAEIERRGFSGYVAEGLVMKHGGLLPVLERFAGHAGTGGGRPFSLADPVDAKRDLGTAVSGESLGRMVLASREFLRHPSPAFFRKMGGKANPILTREVVAVAFTHRRLSEDTLWGELRRTTKHLVRHLEVQGFTIVRSMAASNNADSSAILVIPLSGELPPFEQRVGPTVDRGKDVEAFLAANRKGSRLVWVDDDARVRVMRPRKQTALAEALADAAKGRAGAIGASRELEAGMKKSARVLTGPALVRAAAAKRWLRDGIRAITTDAIGTS